HRATIPKHGVVRLKYVDELVRRTIQVRFLRVTQVANIKPVPGVRTFRAVDEKVASVIAHGPAPAALREVRRVEHFHVLALRRTEPVIPDRLVRERAEDLVLVLLRLGITGVEESLAVLRPLQARELH